MQIERINQLYTTGYPLKFMFTLYFADSMDNFVLLKNKVPCALSQIRIISIVEAGTQKSITEEYYSFGIERVSFINPIDSTKKEDYGKFVCHVGKVISFKNPPLFDALENIRITMNKAGGGNADVLTEWEFNYISPTEFRENARPIWTDHHSFWLNNQKINLLHMGSVIDEITLANGSPTKEYFVPPRFDYYSIDSIRIYQKANGVEYDGSSLMIQCGKSKISAIISGISWEDVYKPSDVNNLNLIKQSPEDFYANILGGGNFGGLFAPNNIVLSEKPYYFDTFCIQPIPSGNRLLLKAFNPELPITTNISLEVAIEISFWKKVN